MHFLPSMFDSPGFASALALSLLAFALLWASRRRHRLVPWLAALPSVIVLPELALSLANSDDVSALFDSMGPEDFALVATVSYATFLQGAASSIVPAVVVGSVLALWVAARSPRSDEAQSSAGRGLLLALPVAACAAWVLWVGLAKEWTPDLLLGALCAAAIAGGLAGYRRVDAPASAVVALCGLQAVAFGAVASWWYTLSRVYLLGGDPSRRLEDIRVISTTAVQNVAMRTTLPVVAVVVVLAAAAAISWRKPPVRTLAVGLAAVLLTGVLSVLAHDRAADPLVHRWGAIPPELEGGIDLPTVDATTESIARLQLPISPPWGECLITRRGDRWIGRTLPGKLPAVLGGSDCPAAEGELVSSTPPTIEAELAVDASLPATTWLQVPWAHRNRVGILVPLNTLWAYWSTRDYLTNRFASVNMQLVRPGALSTLGGEETWVLDEAGGAVQITGTAESPFDPVAPPPDPIFVPSAWTTQQLTRLCAQTSNLGRACRVATMTPEAWRRWRRGSDPVTAEGRVTLLAVVNHWQPRGPREPFTVVQGPGDLEGLYPGHGRAGDHAVQLRTDDVLLVEADDDHLFNPVSATFEEETLRFEFAVSGRADDGTPPSRLPSLWGVAVPKGPWRRVEFVRGGEVVGSVVVR